MRVALPWGFYQPNLTIYALEQRACGTCGHVGLTPVPFGAGCPVCHAVQVVSGLAIHFEQLPFGAHFYLVGSEAYPYVVWRKSFYTLVGADGQPVVMTGAADHKGERIYAFLPNAAFVIPVHAALIADRFSFN